MTKPAAMENGAIDGIIAKYPCEPGSLIQVLLEIQREFRWLPEEALQKVGQRLGVPMSRIRQIISFYKAFSLIPKGRHEINICTGTACHVRGAPRILDAVQEITGIRPGETDTDLRFTLETVNCVGCCALGPVIVIDGDYHGKITPAQSEDVLKSYA